MMQLIAGGLIGLMLGAGVCLSGLCVRERLRAALALHAGEGLRWMLLCMGESVLLGALLMWLAVIDVDLLQVLPLHAGVIAGGVLYGLMAGFAGLTPLTALAGAGGGRLLESLCALAGCVAGALALDALPPLMDKLQNVLPLGARTIFRVTLDEPYVFSGGFLAQGCLGALLLALGLCCPRPRQEASPAEEEIPPPQEDAVVAVLPGEDPLVVDAGAVSAQEDEGQNSEDSDNEDNDNEDSETDESRGAQEE